MKVNRKYIGAENSKLKLTTIQQKIMSHNSSTRTEEKFSKIYDKQKLYELLRTALLTNGKDYVRNQASYHAESIKIS